MEYNTNYNPKAVIEDIIAYDINRSIFYDSIYPAILKSCRAENNKLDEPKLFNCLEEVIASLRKGRSLETIRYVIKNPDKAIESINSKASLPFPKVLKGNRVSLDVVEGNNSSDYEAAVCEGGFESGVKNIEAY